MKQAGAKNSGAWFRFNKWLNRGGSLGGHQNTGVVAALKAKILEGSADTFDNFFNVLLGMATDAGVTTGYPATKEAMLDAWLANGVPLQVWMGRLSWTEYDVTGAGAGAVYTARGQSEAHYFAKDLRRVIRHFVPSVRELFDVANAVNNNPGFMPNAHKHVKGAAGD